MPKLMTQNEFIERCIKKFKDKFDYSKVEYKNAKTKVVICCKRHGWFEMNPWRHWSNKTGCFKCAHEDIGIRKKKTTETFISEAEKIFGNLYDYSKSDYTGADNKIEIICKRHGSFWQRPANHLSGMGCKQCGNLLTQDEFVNRCNQIHLNRYDYSQTKYKHNKEKIKIICPVHGEFEQRASLHVNGKGCQRCNLSKGEREIRRWLENKNIEFNVQKEFDDCINPKTKFKLKFDFYLPKQNILIEYDGQQHFFINSKWTKDTEEQFRSRQMKDEIKNEYASSKGIKLIRIKYSKWRTISKILDREIIKE